MSNIVKRFRETLLGADEKVLRKYGLRDECGWTQEALEVLEQKLLNDNREFLVKVAKDLAAEDKAKK